MIRSSVLASAGLLLGFLVLPACSTVGEKEFACPRPQGAHCMSATQVYQATQTGDFVPPTVSSKSADATSSGHARASSATTATSVATKHHHSADSAAAPEHGTIPTSVVRTGSTLPAVDKPLPIRTPAQVIRIWIAPWEDAQGVLHTGGYAFIEVEGRKWSFGETSHPLEPARFFSLQDIPETKKPVGKDPSTSEKRLGSSERPKPTAFSPLPTSGVSP